MGKLLWKPSQEQINQANLTKFINFVNARYALSIGSYDELYKWSIEKIPDFWASVWEFTGIKASRRYHEVVDDLNKFPGAKWFAGARLNFAENLLRYRDSQPAFIFRGETQKSAIMTYAELYASVARLAASLRAIGLRPGDRVAAYMPNLIETAVAILATTSIGAIWSSCATDLGAQAALDRLDQIEPRVLFTADGYFYKGQAFDSLPNVSEIAKGLPSLEKVIVVRYRGGNSSISVIPNSIYYQDFIAPAQADIHFEQLPFNHPAFIMFSSGTTGQPKCLVQGGGGVLINHLKELVLHTDLRREDVIFYITTCSWMMWNWLLSSLGVGATIILYDGNPNYPGPAAMWKLVQDEKITVFGTSASYLNYNKNQGLRPGQDFNLSSLREISQTGSALSRTGLNTCIRQSRRTFTLTPFLEARISTVVSPRAVPPFPYMLVSCSEPPWG